MESSLTIINEGLGEANAFVFSSRGQNSLRSGAGDSQTIDFSLFKPLVSVVSRPCSDRQVIRR